MTKLTFIGDIFPGDGLFTRGFGIKSKTDKEHVKLWTNNITKVVGKADYIIGNLESPLIEDSEAADETFYGSPLFADILKDSGINVLHIANNHILEHSDRGFKNTIFTLHERKIHTIGEVKDGKSNILTIEQDGAKICLAGFCDEHICDINNPNCYASLEEEKVLETLERMKLQQPDIIIFCFHWGNEYIHIPSLEQRKLSRKLIDNGAHLIIGHHPHVIQPYEKYKNGQIIYSLGNFCFDDVQSEHFKKGMLAKVEIENRSIQDITFEGIIVQDMGYHENLVAPMSQQSFECYFQKINNQYIQLQEISDKAYQRFYQQTLNQEHNKERIKMRLSIIKKILDIRHQHKRQFLHNIKKYIA